MHYHLASSEENILNFFLNSKEKKMGEGFSNGASLSLNPYCFENETFNKHLKNTKKNKIKLSNVTLKALFVKLICFPFGVSTIN
jgi:hypothetical protein